MPRSPGARHAVTAGRGAPVGAWRNPGICQPRVIPVPVSLVLLSLLAWAERGPGGARGLELHTLPWCAQPPALASFAWSNLSSELIRRRRLGNNYSSFLRRSKGHQMKSARQEF